MMLQVYVRIQSRPTGSQQDSCEHGNSFLGSINGGEFLDKLSGYQLLKSCSNIQSYLKEGLALIDLRKKC
jgi:hypothetical protein